MASWLQSQLKAAEGLLEAVDRTAKTTRVHAGASANGAVPTQSVDNAGSSRTTDRTGTGDPTPAGASTARPKDRNAHAQPDAGPKPKTERAGSGTLRRQSSSSEKKKALNPKVPRIGKIARVPSGTSAEADGRADNTIKQTPVTPHNGPDKQQAPPAPRETALTVEARLEDPVAVTPTKPVLAPDTSAGLGGSPEAVASNDTKSNQPSPSEPEAVPSSADVTIQLSAEQGPADQKELPELPEGPAPPPAAAAEFDVQEEPAPGTKPKPSSNLAEKAEAPEQQLEPVDMAVQPSDTGLEQEEIKGEDKEDDEAACLEADVLPTEVPQTNASSLRGTGSGSGQGAESSSVDTASRQQELLDAKAAVGSGASSREARLQRVCDKLKARLEELKEENAQLEDLLAQADQRATGGAGEVGRLQQELKTAQADRKKETASHRAILDAKESELQIAKEEVTRQHTQIETLEKKLINLEETTEELLRERQSSEGRVITALRDQLAEVEQRIDEERLAHSLSRKAASTRQEQLEAEVSESASALTALQRTVDERTARVAELEDQLASADEDLEGALAKLRRAEESAAREKARAESNNAGELEAQVAAWKEQAEKERKIILDLEEAKAGLERDKARLGHRIEDLEEVTRNAQSAADSDLSKRFKEVTDLLYLKQTQLEKMAAEKAAQQLSMEREVTELREELTQSKRRASSARDPIETYATEMTPMDHMGAAYQRLANDATLGSAVKGFAKAVDVTAASAMRILRNYPLARVIFFVYSILIHLFVYILIQRLQSRYLMVDEGEPDHSKPMNMQP